MCVKWLFELYVKEIELNKWCFLFGEVVFFVMGKYRGEISYCFCICIGLIIVIKEVFEGSDN